MKLSNVQIQRLRKEYGRLNKIPGHKIWELQEIMDAADNNSLKELAKYKVKFVSRLAINRLVRRGFEVPA